MAEQSNPAKSRKEAFTGRSGALQHQPGSFGLFRNDPFWPHSEFPASSPLSLMRRFAENMERAFRGEWEAGGSGHDPYGIWSPVIEVSERENQLIVRADLPGTARDDVRVKVMDDSLVIEGERREEHDEQERGYRRSERRYGRFYRSIPLPEGVQTEQARAEFRNGVLEISVPVIATQSQRGREIPIEASGAPERKESGSVSASQPRVSKAG